MPESKEKPEDKQVESSQPSRGRLLEPTILGTAIEAEALLESILENSPTPIYLKDPRGAYLYVNPAYEQAAGLNREEILGHTDFDVFPYATAATFHKHDLQAMEAATPLQSAELLTKDGGDLIFTSMKFPIFRGSGEVLGICGISMDITDSLRAEYARAEEREHLATELHDDTLQVLATMGLHLENLEREASPPQQKSLAQLRGMVSDALQRLRSLTSDMHLASSAGLDLHVSLVEMLESIEGENSITISLDYQLSESPHSLVAVGLYPIAREALVNAIKHSEASHIDVHVTAFNGGIRITIADDGKGFSEDDTRSAEHMGLSSMRSRVRSLRGELHIDSRKGRGTEVEVWVPDPQQNHGL